MRSKVAGRSLILLSLALASQVVHAGPAPTREALRRWQMMCQIRKDKFDRVLPEAMRENGVDMWIVTLKEGGYDPLYEDLGRGYPGGLGLGYYVFSDKGGDRIERAALGISGYLLEECGVYDIVAGGSDADLAKFVKERDPKKIGLNMAEEIGAADGLSYMGYRKLVKILGDTYEKRFVSAEKLVSDFRSRSVATEVAAFSEAGQYSAEIAERALSNEIVTPGLTTLEDVAWWMQEELLRRGLTSSFDMPSVYVTGPKGIEAVSSPRIIQRGDFLTIDWGVCLMNFCTDVKRQAYVLKAGETEPPAGYRRAFAQALAVRETLRRTLKPGGTAADTLKLAETRVGALPGFKVMTTFNKPYDGDTTDVMIGMHSVGQTGHGIGPSMAFFNPKRLAYEIKPSNMFSIEFFAYTPLAEWGGAKLRIPLEDDAVMTARGIEWLYPHATRLLVVR